MVSSRGISVGIAKLNDLLGLDLPFLPLTLRGRLVWSWVSLQHFDLRRKLLHRRLIALMISCKLLYFLPKLSYGLFFGLSHAFVVADLLLEPCMFRHNFVPLRQVAIDSLGDLFFVNGLEMFDFVGECDSLALAVGSRVVLGVELALEAIVLRLEGQVDILIERRHRVVFGRENQYSTRLA